jgi:hypothetical protein
MVDVNLAGLIVGLVFGAAGIVPFIVSFLRTNRRRRH